MSHIPGPHKLPVVGNLHQVASNLHGSFTELSHQYGDVFRVWLGTHPVVVLNRRRAIEQALITQGEDFAGRPEEMPVPRVISCTRGCSISYKTYGEEWKSRRELVEKAFQLFTDGPNGGILEQHISEEALKLIEFVSQESQRQIFDSTVLTSHSVGNIFTRFLFSFHRELDDPVLMQIYEANEGMLENLGKCAVVNVFPRLEKWIPSKLKGLKKTVVRQMELLEPAIQSSNEKYVDGSVCNVLHYIKTHGSTAMTDGEDIQSVVHDLIGAGQGIIRITLGWIFVYAIAFPELQKEIQDEIDRVVGRERTPTLEDKTKLPLTEAFLVEVIRHSALHPLTTPRMTIKDTVLRGGFDYAIPKGTMVYGNLQSLFQDPQEWKNPSDFNPKRFLSGDQDSLDLNKVHRVMRFGGGQRICVGRHVATRILFMFFSTVMHQCSLKNASAKRIKLEGIPLPGSMAVRAPKVNIEMIRR